MHTRSAAVYPQASAMKNPLFKMLRWLSVAPLGKPVVPLVYWMLMASSGASSDVRWSSCSADTHSPALSRSSQSAVCRYTTAEVATRSQTSSTIER